MVIGMLLSTFSTTLKFTVHLNFKLYYTSIVMIQAFPRLAFKSTIKGVGC